MRELPRIYPRIRKRNIYFFLSLHLRPPQQRVVCPFFYFYSFTRSLWIIRAWLLHPPQEISIPQIYRKTTRTGGTARGRQGRVSKPPQPHAINALPASTYILLPTLPTYHTPTHDHIGTSPSHCRSAARTTRTTNLPPRPWRFFSARRRGRMVIEREHTPPAKYPEEEAEVPPTPLQVAPSTTHLVVCRAE